MAGEPEARPLLGSSPPAPREPSESHDGQNEAWLSERLHESPFQSSFLKIASGTSAKNSPRLVKRTQVATVTRARRTAWICIDARGKRSFLHADKRSLITQLGLNIPIRDMRLLDFGLLTSETGKLLVRDNAMLFSIEHVRLIITADKVLLPREGYEHNPLSNRFVDHLEEAIAEWVRQQCARPASVNQDMSAASDWDDDQSGSVRQEDQTLPFELVVLEAALKEMVNASAQQVKELEGIALPALDALTKSVSTSNLERVRKVKTRHQRLVIRCETLRDELERFLQDDDDMLKMCLTRRKELEQQHRALPTPERPGLDILGSLPSGAAAGRTTPQPYGGSVTRRSYMMGLTTSLSARAGSVGGPGSPTRGGGAWTRMESQNDANGGMAGASEEELNEAAAEDVENLLESYFMQSDSLCDKLTSVGEYIKDTEEYINIELDSSRNKLIRLEIVLTAATFAIAPFNLVAGILGENLVIPQRFTRSVSGFWVINAAALLTCFFCFYSIIMYMRYRKLI